MARELATAKIGAIVEQYHAKGLFEGIALVADSGSVIYRGAVGQADRSRSIPHSPEAPFPICSLTKQFTALLVMQQVAAGRLKWDGVLTDFLPDFKGETSKRITLKHLLSHTSGLPNTDDLPGFYETKDARQSDLTFLVRTFLSGKPLTAPGEKFRYNNGDYLLLSVLLEKMTGKPYSTLLHEQILRPLGMSRSGLISPKSPNRVLSYDTATGSAVSNTAYRLENYGAAGGMYASGDDLLRWDRALLSDRLLPRKFRDLMWTSDPAKGYVACGSWVYGYQKYGNKMPVFVERQGGIGALHAQNLLVPDDGYRLILLSNLDTCDLAAYSGHGIACDILRVLYT